MKHSEFRALETQSHSDRTDDLLTGAVIAFCSLTRPLRHDVVQLEELSMPLLVRASERARRHAAAALSESPDAPRALVLALCREPIEISAPILLRSPVLTTLDLAAIVHRQGLPHARVIARRRAVEPDLARLLHSFGDPAIERALALRERSEAAPPTPRRRPRPSSPADATTGVDAVRAALRDIMEESAAPATETDERSIADRLIERALDDNDALFETAFADALGISFERAGRILGEAPGADFFSCLKSLDLGIQDAYFLTGLVYGVASADKAELRQFAHSYDAIDAEAARAAIRRWKAEEISDYLRRHRPARDGAAPVQARKPA